ncbi:MAG: hypothetical protein K1X57_19495 [Gemmataceae bacterium]|nr:hypothetical protein [Gemmataceae bacterium]
MTIPRVVSLVCALSFNAASPVAHAQPILVACTAGVAGSGPQPTSKLVTVDTLTGQFSNYRDIGIKVMSGIATQPGTGILFGLTSDFSIPVNSLIRIDTNTGQPITVGPTGLSGVVEGDLAFNPVNGLLYGIQDGGPLGNQRNLFQIDPVTGSATVVGSLGSTGDYSALMFGAIGILYTINSSGLGQSQLLTVDPTDGHITSSISMNVNLGSAVGLAMDPTSGIVYLADNASTLASGGTNSVYSLDLISGAATLIGPTGDSYGAAGLAVIGVPEPPTWIMSLMTVAAMYSWPTFRNGFRLHC